MQSTTSTTLDFTAQHLTGAHIREMEKFNKYDKKNLEAHFDSVADNYEGIYKRAGYPDPQKCTDVVSNYVKNNKRLVKEDVEICDFACGTGLVGQCLKNAGFQRIYGIDVSTKMIEQARKKECYKAFNQLELGQEEFQQTFPPLWKNRFDVVTCAGLIDNNHMDEKIFQQMLLALKNGGLMIFTAQYSFLGKYWYDDKLDTLEKLGRMRPVSVDEYFAFGDLAQPCGKFAKTPCKMFVYQKTEADSVMAYKRTSSLTQEQIKELMNQAIRNKMKEKFAAKFCFQKKSTTSIASGSTQDSVKQMKPFNFAA